MLASAAIEIGTNEKPIPTAMTRNPGRRSPTYEPPTDTWVKYGQARGQERHARDEHRLDAHARDQLRGHAPTR